MTADYDSPWKEGLDIYFEPFLALLFPEAHAGIDWSRGFESLDKEFQQVVREAELGRRFVDKLFKVWVRDGSEYWILIHIEVQTTHDGKFPERMYVYNYRIFDRYNKPVASFAVLADDDPNWRPSEFRQSVLGCETGIRFPMVKLLDFAAHEAELTASSNPFATLVLAHLQALRTRGDPAARQASKTGLVRSLFERGFSAKDVRELFRLIDWIMVLPSGLEKVFQQDVAKIQEEKHMPYVTSIERVAERRGMCAGIASLLKVHFGEQGLVLMPEIEEIHDGEKLREILKALETKVTLDEVRRIWAPPSA